MRYRFHAYLLFLSVLLAGVSARAQQAFQVFIPDLFPAGKRPAVQTPDGGFCILASREKSERTNSRFVLIKTTSDGTVEWMRLYAPPSSNDYPAAIRQTADGGFIVVGNTAPDPAAGKGDLRNQDIMVLRLNADGHPLWCRKYHQSEVDWAGDVALLDDGSAIIVGATHARHPIPGTPNDPERAGADSRYWTCRRAFALRIAPDGEVLWGGTFNELPLGGDTEFPFYGSFAEAVCAGNGNSATMVIQTDQDSYAVGSGVVLDISSEGILSDGLLMRAMYPNDGLPSAPFINDIIPLSDGGRLLAGTRRYHNSNSYTMVGSHQGFLVRLDEGNRLLWKKTYDNTPTDNPFPLTVAPIGEDRYLLAGRTLFGNIFESGYDNPIIALVDGKGAAVRTKQWTTSFQSITTVEGMEPFLAWPHFIPTDDRGVLSVGTVQLSPSRQPHSPYHWGTDFGLLLTRFNPDITTCGADETRSVTVDPGTSSPVRKSDFDDGYYPRKPLDVVPSDFRDVPNKPSFAESGPPVEMNPPRDDEDWRDMEGEEIMDETAPEWPFVPASTLVLDRLMVSSVLLSDVEVENIDPWRLMHCRENATPFTSSLPPDEGE